MQIPCLSTAAPAGLAVALSAFSMADDDSPYVRVAQESAERDRLSELLVAVAKGERSALSEVYQRTHSKLYGICLRLLESENDAQDTLQDVYLTIWRKAGSFDRSKASPITWLSVMARNRSIDRLRQRRTRDSGIDEALDVPSDEPSAFEIAAAVQDRARLADCLETLDERARMLIRSAFLGGSTYSELATRESVPLGTMKSWIRRGLKALRGCLET